ncbi:MAG TPA: carbon-nitrogen hydrolase family protein [Chitinophagaceae bacterium]|jgi:predicted amidohydrolase|nr:carbon-nitrogen hydrolase family protein [Chitinophagaceae bacterium]
MKICVAQTKAVKGDIHANIDNHKKFVGLAVSHEADMIVFPELSLTGYEPALAKGLATNKDDERFRELQELSDSMKITVGAGMPIKTDHGVLIGMIIFQPRLPREIYFKQHLHPDEESHFIHGTYQPALSKKKIAIAICYEISIPVHSEQAYKNGATIYIASVAKTVDGMTKALNTLSATAEKYSLSVLVSNCVGECEGKKAGGRSSVWDSKGRLLAQLNETDEGLLIFDTDTKELIKRQKEHSFSK